MADQPAGSKAQIGRHLVRLLQYIRPYRRRVLATALLTLVVTVTSGLPMPLIMQYFLDEVIAKGAWERLNYVFWAIVIVYVIQSLSSFAQTYQITYLGRCIILKLRQQLYDHLQKLSLSFYDKRQTGKIMSRIIDDVAVLQRLISRQVVRIFTDLITVVVILFVIFSKNWKLALVSLTVLPFYVMNYKYFVFKIRSTSRAIRSSMDIVLGRLQETLAGTYVVKSFAQEERETETFRENTWETLQLNMRQGLLSIYFSSAAGVISGLGTAIVLWYGGYEVIRGALTIGELMAFYGFIGYLYRPTIRLTEINNMLQRSLVSIERVFEVLDTRPDVEDEGEIVLPPIEGHVVFRNVCFGYSPDTFVLDTINLEVQPGMMVALVGHTGCGKSTLVNLIPRFYDPVLGQILVDGYDLCEVTLDSLRAQIGIVLQESILFDDTVRNNLCYGKLEATDAHLEAAAKAANIDDFIRSLPQGYATKIGEEGVQLSLGQKQRLAIARAIVTDPRILILDEATSSLDSESEALIQDALKNVMRGRTSFVIAHRLATILQADLIVILDHGKIVETGIHEELLQKGGLYSMLYKEQFKAVAGEQQTAAALVGEREQGHDG